MIVLIGFVWEIEVPTDGVLMSFFFAILILLFIFKVDLADRVLALASKRCLLCSAVYSHGVVETKSHC